MSLCGSQPCQDTHCKVSVTPAPHLLLQRCRHLCPGCPGLCPGRRGAARARAPHCRTAVACPAGCCTLRGPPGAASAGPGGRPRWPVPEPGQKPPDSSWSEPAGSCAGAWRAAGSAELEPRPAGCTEGWQPAAPSEHALRPPLRRRRGLPGPAVPPGPVKWQHLAAPGCLS